MSERREDSVNDGIESGTSSVDASHSKGYSPEEAAALGLRPVGAIIECVLPPANIGFVNAAAFGQASGTTSPSGMNFTVWKYKIVGHSKTTIGPTESVEAVREEGNPRHIAPKMWVRRYGSLVPIPPDELLPLMDKSWNESLFGVSDAKE